MERKFESFEQLFVSEQFDKKNKLNRSTKKISAEIIEKIESDGITLEMLNTLQVPVFKYKGQITIHGLFPEMDSIRVGSYKNVFQNENKSIGVKYNAIDFAKKQNLFQTLKAVSDFRTTYNSNNYYAYLQYQAGTKEDAVKIYKEKIEPIVKRIDKTLFVGSVNSGIGFIPMYGYFPTLYLKIVAFPEQNETKILENVLGVTMLQIQNIVAEREAERKAKREAYRISYEAERKKEKEIEAENQQRLDEYAKAKGLQKTSEITDAGIYMYCDGTDIKIIQAIKKRKLSFRTDYYNTLETALKAFEGDQKTYGFHYKADTIKVKQGAYFVPEQPTKEASTSEAKEVAKKVESPKTILNIEIVAYSEKAIAIFGDTKAKKEILKELGCKFNPYLNKEGKKVAGWIAPKSKLLLIEKALS